MSILLSESSKGLAEEGREQKAEAVIEVSSRVGVYIKNSPLI